MKIGRRKRNIILTTVLCVIILAAWTIWGNTALDLCQYFGQKKSKNYAAFLSPSSSFCCGVM